MMKLEQAAQNMLPAIEANLKHQVERLDQPRMKPFYEMLTYHMGWTGEGAGNEAVGKRIRPLLLLLVVDACGGKWLRAVEAAAAVELIHNFSLVHDDIQDHSDKRRGRLTVWKKWGAPMAINVGDALFVIANLAITGLLEQYPAEVVVRTAKILLENCLYLTSGQFLDMSYERHTDLSMEDYWPMIQGKTSALLAACTQIGSILGGADESAIEGYRLFGLQLGLAFQVQDDFLGIWGQEQFTGKSVSSDLEEGKNSLPIIYGISQKGRFAQRWKQGNFQPEEIQSIAQLLADEGGREYTAREAQRLSQMALATLYKTNPDEGATEGLVELVNKLLGRKT